MAVEPGKCQSIHSWDLNMKTISLDEAGPRIADSLDDPSLAEPLIIMDGEEEVAFVIGIPKSLRSSDRWQSFVLDSLPMPGEAIDEPAGETPSRQTERQQAVFGSCRGMLTIHSDDDEPLMDFAEYMP